MGKFNRAPQSPLPGHFEPKAAIPDATTLRTSISWSNVLPDIGTGGMKQQDRINSVSNDWEADPWDASDEVACAQLSGFQSRATKPIKWISIRNLGPSIFGIDVSKLTSADVEFCATHDDEELLLMQLIWHGWPDPPEWRLASRPCHGVSSDWASWGYFSELPAAWKMPEASKL